MRTLGHIASFTVLLALGAAGCIGIASYERTLVLDPPGEQLGSKYDWYFWEDGHSVGVRLRVYPEVVIDVAACVDSEEWWPVSFGPILPVIPWPPGIVRSAKGAPHRPMKLGILVGTSPRPLEITPASLKLSLEDGSVRRPVRATMFEDHHWWLLDRPVQRQYSRGAQILCKGGGLYQEVTELKLTDVSRVSTGQSIVFEFDGSVPSDEEVVVSFGTVSIRRIEVKIPNLRFRRGLGWAPIPFNA